MEAYSKITNRLRKIAARTKEALLAAMSLVLGAVSAEDAHGFFIHCGYPDPVQQI